MVRDRAEINPKIAEHLNRLIKEQGIKQTEFAERVGVSVVTANRWVRGKSGLSAYNAEQISRAFPSYSTDYLLGMSDYPNEIEEARADRGKRFRDFCLLDDSVKGLMKLNGIDEVKLYEEMHYDENGEYLDSDGHYEISANGITINITVEQYDAFMKEVSAYVGFRLNQFFERGCL